MSKLMITIIVMLTFSNCTYAQFELLDNTASYKEQKEQLILPETEIISEDTFKVGDIILLSVKPIQKPDYLESVSYSWVVLPDKQTIIWPDSTKIIFGTGDKPTTYTVILTASYVYLHGNKITQKSATTTVSINITENGTSIEPKNTSIENIINNCVKQIMPYDQYQQDKEIISRNFATIATMIDNNTLSDIQDIMNETKKLNGNISNKEIWSNMFDNLSQYLTINYNNGSITSMQQYSQIWTKVSQQLK